ncbi:MAG TPA: hypothetical protein VK935_13795 [Actinomycetospora sp.]|nr:hypothetical protein [Actinomycetospora sp.]
MRSPSPQAPSTPANRAERRAAARGKVGDAHAARVSAPRRVDPREHTKPVHVRTDFAARRTG